MQTASKASFSTQTVSSLRSSRSSAGLTSEGFNRDNPLSQTTFRWQNRSSANGSNQTATRSALVNRLLVLQGRNPSAIKVAGNGTTVTTTVQQMHHNGAWEFFSYGWFRFTPAGLGTFARTDLYPIVGTYRSTNSGISFSGSRSSSNLTSRNSVAIQGNIFVQNGGIRASLLQRTVLINAAVVNGSRFGNAIDRTVRVDMNMVRIA